ncbi:hypothetical protein D0B54_19260 [Solimonas sp. K1W22B-7]|nr:hypothetical protein D0B54_19260 [Solimonas sp. K1W22B-7]
MAGDALGLEIPAHAAALREGGIDFLTTAFRACGALAADNRVVGITRFEECPGGSTGRKLLLSVAYQRSQAGLHSDLFVKFSRDFDDPIRDRGRSQMEREVRFALLAREPGFPIAVPACLFADFHRESGTGILVTQCIAYGKGAIEPHYEKCMDEELPEALAHSEALLRSVARLAAAQKAGRLSEAFTRQFPFDISQLSVGERTPYTARQLQNRVDRYAQFAAGHPALLPQNIRAPAFIARLREDVVRFPGQEAAIKDYLGSRPEFIALCHWNANIDNAWFWRSPAGVIECGLMDWGCVSQMNLAMAIWGAMSGAGTELWDRHLDALLSLFVAELRAGGGPSLDPQVLRRMLMLYIAIMGLTWLLDAPPYLRSLVPDLAELKSRFDPRIRGNEAARSQLQMLTTFLNLWDRQDFGFVLDEHLTCAA